MGPRSPERLVPPLSSMASTPASTMSAALSSMSSTLSPPGTKSSELHLDQHRIIGADDGAYRAYDLDDQSGPVGDGAAVFVLPFVKKGRQELAQQVAMRAVDLHGIATRSLRPPGRRGKRLGDHGDVGRRHLPAKGAGVGLPYRRAEGLRRLGGRLRTLFSARRRSRRRPEAGVRDLQRYLAPGLVDRSGEAPQPRDRRVIVDAELLAARPPLRADEGMTADDQPYPAPREPLVQAGQLAGGAALRGGQPPQVADRTKRLGRTIPRMVVGSKSADVPDVMRRPSARSA